MLRVFVYGTLKPGERYYPQYCEGKVVEWQEAIATGLLYDFPQLGYPAMTAGDGKVYGVVLTFADESALEQLDELEDYASDRTSELNEYDRVQIEVIDLEGSPLSKAWVYLMSPQRIKQLEGVLLPEGYWTGQMSP